MNRRSLTAMFFLGFRVLGFGFRTTMGILVLPIQAEREPLSKTVTGTTKGLRGNGREGFSGTPVEGFRVVGFSGFRVVGFLGCGVLGFLGFRDQGLGTTQHMFLRSRSEIMT